MSLDKLNIASLPKFGELQTKLHDCGNELDAPRQYVLDSLYDYLVSNLNVFQGTEYTKFFKETNLINIEDDGDEINTFDIYCVESGSQLDCPPSMASKSAIFQLRVVIDGNGKIKITLNLANNLINDNYRYFCRGSFNLVESDEIDSVDVIEQFAKIRTDLYKYVQSISYEFSNAYRTYEEHQQAFYAFKIELNRKVTQHYENTLENICIERYASCRHINIDNRKYSLKKSEKKKFKIVDYRWNTYLYDVVEMLITRSKYYGLPHITRY